MLYQHNGLQDIYFPCLPHFSGNKLIGANWNWKYRLILFFWQGPTYLLPPFPHINMTANLKKKSHNKPEQQVFQLSIASYHKVSQTSWLKTREMYYLTVLQVRNPGTEWLPYLFGVWLGRNQGVSLIESLPGGSEENLLPNSFRLVVEFSSLWLYSSGPCFLAGGWILSLGLPSMF